MSIKDLERIVKMYYEKLSFMHPLIGSDKFVTNSNHKWACKEILREIGMIDSLPFHLEAWEILQNFSEKMKLYAGKNERNSKLFLDACDTAEYLIEEGWRFDSNKSKWNRR